MKKLYLLIISLFVFTISNAQIGFQERIIIDIENWTKGANSLYVVDIDGDGDQDVITASDIDDKIAWYENVNGLGEFGFQHIITTDALGANAVFAADIDGDGDMDVLSASYDDTKITWYENTDGQGSFISHIITDDLGGANAVFASDIDGDGDMDVLSSGDGLHSLAWFENIDGQGTFGSLQEINPLLFGGSVYSDDIDGDGDMDILSAYFASGNNGKIIWYENLDGQGFFGTPQIITDNAEYATSASAVDIDGDGDMDVISSSKGDDKVAWYENLDGQGTFGAQQIITDSLIEAPYAYFSDIDGDGDMDVISAQDAGGGTIVWFENIDGNGNFSSQQIINIDIDAVEPKIVYASDLDGDGDMDVLSVSRNDSKVAWYENTDGQGSFGPQQLINNYVNNPVFVYASDLDGDGDLDILSASAQDDKIAWYENLNGQGAFGNQQVISISEDIATSVHAADIDGDGDMDVLTTCSWGSSYLSWYENLDGLGGFGPRQIISNGAGNYVDSADIDGDGDIDLFSADASSGLDWHENLDGLGTFDTPQFIAYGSYCAKAVDIDGDGDIDVIVVRDDSISWHENLDGLGNFSDEYIITTEVTNARSAFASDLDGDGDMDVLSTSSYDNEIAWYENMDGLGDFGPQQIIIPNANGVNFVFAADIDGDSDMDVISSSLLDDRIAWYENLDGQGNFSLQKVISNNADGAMSVFVGDLNSDGIMDVLSASFSDDKIAWYENLGILGNQITGNIKIDIDTNGCDDNDFPMSNLMIVTDNGNDSFATFTNSNGDYIIHTNPGVFTTGITSNLPDYYSSNPISHTSTFNDLGNMDIADFCVEPNQAVNDVSTSIYPLNEARPGFEAFYQIVYQNSGTTILSSDIVVTFDDPKITFESASEPTSSQTSNSITFVYSELYPFETRTIDLTFNVSEPPTTEIDDILFFTCVINPIVGDINEANNTATFNQMVVGSYDPNDIRVLEGDEIFLEEVDDYLHYIIRFQNTGSASAIFVHITNELDPNLDWNTFQIENISHSNRVEITDGNQVEFIFDGIYLPDSTTNEPESHGYIQYKIKPKNTVDIGDSMANHANIYFDFNPPIVTNTVTTTVIEDLSVNDNNMNEITIYPNPTKGILNVKANGLIIENIAIINLQGIVLKNTSNKNEIDVSNLATGIYFIQLSVEGKSITKKFIKN